MDFELLDFAGEQPEDSRPFVFTVSELTAQIKELLETGFPFIGVVGELSNLSTPRSGHMYFTLKDEKAQIRAVCFRANRTRIKFTPENGMEVLCIGRLNVYEPRGEYQIIVQHMEPRGIGAIQAEIEKLKRKLEAEGLFKDNRKKPMPFCPQRILVITSATGAAIRDILRVLRGAPFATEVTLAPVQVQGDEAAADIANALGLANVMQSKFMWDVVIVGRGGGSMEDLLAFNTEIVARAIADCTIPTISAVGHEIDFTISDLVADLRVPTPTAAAEWIVKRQREVESKLREVAGVLIRAISHRIELYGQRLGHLKQSLKDPQRMLDDRLLWLDDRMERLIKTMIRILNGMHSEVELLRERLLRTFGTEELDGRIRHLENLDNRLRYAMSNKLTTTETRLKSLESLLNMLSPYNVLERGYCIVYRKSDGKIVRESEDVIPGNTVEIRPARGKLECLVLKSRKEWKEKRGGEKVKKGFLST